MPDPSSKIVLALCSAALALSCLAVGCQPGNRYVPPPPPEVTVSPPLRQSVMSYLEYTGTTKSIETVDLRARVKGFLKQRLFREGEDVKEGQLLLVIDEEPFQVALQARRGEARGGPGRRQEGRGIEGQGGGPGAAQPRSGRLSTGPRRGESSACLDPSECRLAGRPGQGRGRPQEGRGPGSGRPRHPRAGPGRLRDEPAHGEGQRGPGRG